MDRDYDDDNEDVAYATFCFYKNKEFYESIISYYVADSKIFKWDFDNITEAYTKGEILEAQSEDGWKKSYIKYMYEHGLRYDDLFNTYRETYKLINVDEDNVPELYINYGTTAEGGVICSYQNGELVEQDVADYGLTYIENEGIFKSTGGNMDIYHDYIYTLKNGKMEMVAEGNYGAPDNSNVQYDANGEPVYEYYWNDKEVATESEYNKELNKVFDTKRASDPFAGTKLNESTGREEGNGMCGYEDMLEVIYQY